MKVDIKEVISSDDKLGNEQNGILYTVTVLEKLPK